MTEAHLDVAYSRFLLATDYERRLEQHERRILAGSMSRRLVRSLANRWTGRLCTEKCVPHQRELPRLHQHLRQTATPDLFLLKPGFHGHFSPALSGFESCMHYLYSSHQALGTGFVGKTDPLRCTVNHSHH